jgi:hypothetical protein
MTFGVADTFPFALKSWRDIQRSLVCGVDRMPHRPSDPRRTRARLCHETGGELEQISVSPWSRVGSTTERLHRMQAKLQRSGQ